MNEEKPASGQRWIHRREKFVVFVDGLNNGTVRHTSDLDLIVREHKLDTFLRIYRFDGKPSRP